MEERIVFSLGAVPDPFLLTPLPDDTSIAMHIHAHLSILIDGQPQVIPEGIGLTPDGDLPLHTHDATGLIHVESPVVRDFTLGDFFTVWGQPFSPQGVLGHAADATHALSMIVNGQPSQAFASQVLHDGDNIVIRQDEVTAAAQGSAPAPVPLVSTAPSLTRLDAISAALVTADPPADPTVTPSAIGHVTDGQFDVINGRQEWSDVQSVFFPTSNSFLYADQANLHHPPGSRPDTFMLMYDEVGQTAALGPDQYFLVNFSTVENENGHPHLNFYTDHIFSDGRIIFFENGVLQHDANGDFRVPEIGGQRGKVGFGPSPNSAAPHEIVEFQIALSANQVVVNGGYGPGSSPWGSRPLPPPPCDPKTKTRIPVQIDIYKDSTVTADQAMQYVKQASDILQRDFNNQVMLQPMIGQIGFTDLFGSGDLSNPTAAKLRILAGNTEAYNTFPGGKGVKIVFVSKLPTEADGTRHVGDSIPGDHSSLINGNDSDFSKDPRDPGLVIAHELGHELGLPQESNKPPPPESNDPNNLMYKQINPDNKAKLDDNQKKTVCDNLGGFGDQVNDPSPGELVPQQGGAVADDMSELAQKVPSYFDLAAIKMDSTTDDPSIHTVLTLADPFPSSGIVDATYRVLFDSDANSATGARIAGFSGIDKEVLIHVTGEASIRPLSVAGTLVDYTRGGARTPISLHAQLANLPFADDALFTPVVSHISFLIPKADLDLSADDVPVGVVSESAAAVRDTAALVFDADLYLDEPALNLTRLAFFVGDSVPFTIHRLTPNSAFVLNLGQQQVLSGTLDSTGSFSGSFALPLRFAPGISFLTAEDSTGASAFNIIQAVPRSPNIINNGTIELGVNDMGDLNVPGIVPSEETHTTLTGLRYLPTNAEVAAPGDPAEGWGVADAMSGVTGFADRGEGSGNVNVLNFTSTLSTAVSQVKIGDTFRVTHDYHPLANTPNLYEVTVTIENISAAAVDMRYRRVLDWDVEPTAFDEFVTVATQANGVRAKDVLFTSDNGFASADPLTPADSIDFTGDATNNGPDDHGVDFDFDFGKVSAGQSVTFNLYYGAAGNTSDALAAVKLVDAEAYSLAQPDTPGGPAVGTPNTFIMAFNRIGGAPIFGHPDSDGDGVPDELDNAPTIPNPDQKEKDFSGIGVVEETPQLQLGTAAVLQAGTTGTTGVQPISTLVTDQPTVLDRVALVVESFVEAGLTNSAAQLTRDLANGLAEIGLVRPDQMNAFVADVLAEVGLPEAPASQPTAASSPVSASAPILPGFDVSRLAIPSQPSSPVVVAAPSVPEVVKASPILASLIALVPSVHLLDGGEEETPMPYADDTPEWELPSRDRLRRPDRFPLDESPGLFSPGRLPDRGPSRRMPDADTRREPESGSPGPARQSDAHSAAVDLVFAAAGFLTATDQAPNRSWPPTLDEVAPPPLPADDDFGSAADGVAAFAQLAFVLANLRPPDGEEKKAS